MKFKFSMVATLIVFALFMTSVSCGNLSWRPITLDGFGTGAGCEPDPVTGEAIGCEEGFWWMAFHQDTIWANSWNSITGAGIFRTQDAGDTWEQINTPGFGDVNNWAFLGMEYFKGCLYAASWNAFGGEINRSCNAKQPNPTWEVVADGLDFGPEPPQTFGTHMVKHEGTIRVGTFNPPRNFRSWSGNPGTWYQMGEDLVDVLPPEGGKLHGLSDSSVGFIFNGIYFIGTENQPLDGNNTDLEQGNIVFVWDEVLDKWKLAAPPGFGSYGAGSPGLNGNSSAGFNLATLGMTKFKNQFYTTTWNPEGGHAYRTNAEGEPPFVWETVTLDGFGLGEPGWAPWATAVFKNQLWIGGWGSGWTYSHTYPNCFNSGLEFGKCNRLADTADGGFLFRSADGLSFNEVPAPPGSWAKPETGWGSHNPQLGISQMFVIQDKLWVLTQSFGYPGQIWVLE